MAAPPNNDNLLLEDWKMAKDRIKYFDDMVMKIRVGGLPIATVIQAAAFFLDPKFGGTPLVDVLGLKLTIFQLVIGAGLLYLIPIVSLDVLHFILLMKAVKRALAIESMPGFKGNLAITHSLTSRGLTWLHIMGGYAIYAVIFLFGMYLAYNVSFVPVPKP